jgi:hypothetical protein
MLRQHIHGEDLEARKALLDRLGDLVERPDRQLPLQRDVEGVVVVRVALPPRGALLDGGGPLELGRPDEAEVDVRGGAANTIPRVSSSGPSV